MDNESDRDLLIRAEAAYKGAVSDPRVLRPTVADLVARARRARDVEALVVALRAEAWCERAGLANVRARALLDEAVRLARRHHLDRRLADVLVTRAAVNHELGRLGAARRDLECAAALTAGDGSAELLLQQAALDQNIGRLREAADRYGTVLADAGCPPDVKAKAANNLALIEAQLGRTDAAVGRAAEAASAAAEVGPALVAIVAQTTGWVLMQAGRLVESLRQFDHAARLYEAAGLPLGEHYLEHADALSELGLLPEAAAVADRAVAEFSAHGVSLMEAEAHLRAARLALLAGDHHRAAAAAALAADGFRRQRRTAWVARARLVEVEARLATGDAAAGEARAAARAAVTLDRLGAAANAVEAHLVAGRAAAALGRRRAALASLDRAVALVGGAPVLVRLKGRVAAALAAELRGDDAAVLRHCRAGLRDLARHRAALASMELRVRASGHGAELGRVGLRVLLRTEAPRRVLDWMERTRAAASAAVATPPVEGVAEELAALRLVHAELAEARRTGREPRELVARQTALEYRVRRATWVGEAAEGGPAAAVPVGAIRAALEERALAEYGVADGHLFAVVLGRRRAGLVRLGPSAAVLQEAASFHLSLRLLARPTTSPARQAAARASAEFGLRRLHDQLVRPLGVDEEEPLVVVPLADLLRVPWSALHRGPVALAPSASSFARTAARARAADGDVVLVAGPDLPGATTEIDAIRPLHRDPTVLTPPASTVASVTKAIEGADLVHFAGHGLIRSDNPAFSSLLLSDGPLTVHELDLRGIAPRRMVLASCETAADVGYAGDELFGFVSALTGRGTAGLVASAVPVPDTEAVPLMRGLHRRVATGARFADALHGARAAMDRDDPSAFVTWCAFNAFGAA